MRSYDQRRLHVLLHPPYSSRAETDWTCRFNSARRHSPPERCGCGSGMRAIHDSNSLTDRPFPTHARATADPCVSGGQDRRWSLADGRGGGGAGVGELAVGGIVTCISGTQRSLKLLTGRFIRVDRGKTTSANHLATMVQAGALGSFEKPRSDSGCSQSGHQMAGRRR